MWSVEIKTIYEDGNLLVINKPAGLVVFPEEMERRKKLEKEGEDLIDLLLKKRPELKNAGKPPRYGIVHRLDKDTSGILLIAKNNSILNFLQKQFKVGKIEKKYLALIVGRSKENKGRLETLIGRAPKNRKKQKVYLAYEPESMGKRKAITEYKVLKRFENYTLIEVSPKTGRKHQIRCHLSYLGQPIAGDKMYGFKNQPCPAGLKRQFLHASYLKIKLPNGETKEFYSDLPEDLTKVLERLNIKNQI